MTMPNLRQVADSVWRLSLQMPWSELGLVHCYLFADGSVVDLIDCGLKTPQSLGEVRAAVRQLGGRRARIGRLVVTHIHPDHYGGAGELVGEDGAELYLHRLEVPMVLVRYREVGGLLQEVWDYLVVHGVPEAEAEAMKETSLGLRQFVSPAEPTLQLDGEEQVLMGGRQLRVLWTPGHSPGHICLYAADSGLLFSGDHLLPDESPNIGLHPQSTPDPLDDYLRGLRAMVQLGPRLILPSHGEPFTDARRRVRQLVAHHRRRKEQICAIAADGRSGWEVALQVWGRRDLHSMRLALQEGLAHLQSLAHEGRLDKVIDGGRVRWRRPA